MWINVTLQDIADGNDSCDSCPVTLALRRVFGKKVSVSRDFIRIAKNTKNPRNKWSLVPLPDNAKWFVLTYEDHIDIQPFKFWLNDAIVKKVRKSI